MCKTNGFFVPVCHTPHNVQFRWIAQVIDGTNFKKILLILLFIVTFFIVQNAMEKFNKNKNEKKIVKVKFDISYLVV